MNTITTNQWTSEDIEWTATETQWLPSTSVIQVIEVLYTFITKDRGYYFITDSFGNVFITSDKNYYFITGDNDE